MSTMAELTDRIISVGGERDGASEGEPAVDVEAVLAARQRERPDPLDWRRSIVDLMKLLDMDASYGARKELALELGYSEHDLLTGGSAEMNIWLHGEVMKRLADRGFRVPGR